MFKINNALNYKEYYDLSAVAISACGLIDRRRSSLIKTAFGYSNFKIFRTENKKLPIAYILWANVNDESLHNLRLFGQLPKYDYEWIEGRHMVITDIAIAEGWTYIAIPLIKRYLTQKEQFTFKKKNKVKTINNDDYKN